MPIAGDARAVLEQLTSEAKGRLDPKTYAAWVAKLRVLDAEKQAEMDKAMSRDETPIHPLRLCKEVRDFLRRDAILVVDGQEILNFGRQSIPTFVAGHRLNSGPFGCMGVGLPFGIGAKVARPDAQVLVLHGDGSFGINAMEIDTAVRHRIPVVVVISNNGGWTADAPWGDRAQAGPQPRLHPLRPGGDGAGGARRVRREAAGHAARARARVRLGQAGGGQRDHRPEGAGHHGPILRVPDMAFSSPCQGESDWKMGHGGPRLPPSGERAG